MSATARTDITTREWRPADRQHRWLVVADSYLGRMEVVTDQLDVAAARTLGVALISAAEWLEAKKTQP